MEFLEKPVNKSSYGIELDTSHIQGYRKQEIYIVHFQNPSDAESKNVLRNFVLAYEMILYNCSIP
jgi:hypothetical protein